MRKVGLFGGSFDPIHFGHLNLAISLKESCGLDEIVFVPASLSPFKEASPPSSLPEHRLAMLQLATAHVKGFRVLDWEIWLKGPSYTIDTVRRLLEESSMQLHLLLGCDQIPHFHLWKEAEELMRLAPPLIGMRGSEQLGSPLLQNQKIKIPLFEISGTGVRERLNRKMYCDHLVPASVLDYIAGQGLY